MKKVVKYETVDGKTFDDADLAKAHELILETENSLRLGPLGVAYNTGRAEAMLRAMIVHAAEVRDILNRHQRRQPRNGKSKGEAQRTEAA